MSQITNFQKIKFNWVYDTGFVLPKKIQLNQDNLIKQETITIHQFDLKDFKLTPYGEIQVINDGTNSLKISKNVDRKIPIEVETQLDENDYILLEMINKTNSQDISYIRYKILSIQDVTDDYIEFNLELNEQSFDQNEFEVTSDDYYFNFYQMQQKIKTTVLKPQITYQVYEEQLYNGYRKVSNPITVEVPQERYYPDQGYQSEDSYYKEIYINLTDQRQLQLVKMNNQTQTNEGIKQMIINKEIVSRFRDLFFFYDLETLMTKYSLYGIKLQGTGITSVYPFYSYLLEFVGGNITSTNEGQIEIVNQNDYTQPIPDNIKQISDDFYLIQKPYFYFSNFESEIQQIPENDNVSGFSVVMQKGEYLNFIKQQVDKNYHYSMQHKVSQDVSSYRINNYIHHIETTFIPFIKEVNVYNQSTGNTKTTSQLTEIPFENYQEFNSPEILQENDYIQYKFFTYYEDRNEYFDGQVLLEFGINLDRNQTDEYGNSIEQMKLRRLLRNNDQVIEIIDIFGKSIQLEYDKDYILEIPIDSQGQNQMYIQQIKVKFKFPIVLKELRIKNLSSEETVSIYPIDDFNQESTPTQYFRNYFDFIEQVVPTFSLKFYDENMSELNSNPISLHYKPSYWDFDEENNVLTYYFNQENTTEQGYSLNPLEQSNIKMVKVFIKNYFFRRPIIQAVQGFEDLVITQNRLVSGSKQFVQLIRTDKEKSSSLRIEQDEIYKQFDVEQLVYNGQDNFKLQFSVDGGVNWLSFDETTLTWKTIYTKTEQGIQDQTLQEKIQQEGISLQTIVNDESFNEFPQEEELVTQQQQQEWLENHGYLNSLMTNLITSTGQKQIDIQIQIISNGELDLQKRPILSIFNYILYYRKDIYEDLEIIVGENDDNSDLDGIYPITKDMQKVIRVVFDHERDLYNSELEVLQKIYDLDEQTGNYKWSDWIQLQDDSEEKSLMFKSLTLNSKQFNDPINQKIKLKYKIKSPNSPQIVKDIRIHYIGQYEKLKLVYPEEFQPIQGSKQEFVYKLPRSIHYNTQQFGSYRELKIQTFDTRELQEYDPFRSYRYIPDLTKKEKVQFGELNRQYVSLKQTNTFIKTLGTVPQERKMFKEQILSRKQQLFDDEMEFFYDQGLPLDGDHYLSVIISEIPDTVTKVIVEQYLYDGSRQG